MDTGTAFLALLRGAHLAALLSLFGTLLFAVVVAPAVLRSAPGATGPVQATLTRLARLSLCLALALGIAWFVAEAHATAATDSPRNWLAALPTVARDMLFGQVCALRLVLLLATMKLQRQAPVTAVGLAGLALALQPALSHAGAPDGAAGVLVGSEALHLLAAGAWFGGLLPLLVCIARFPPPQAALACQRFTALGLVAVCVIAITAFLQAGQLVGSVPGLFGTDYGRVALLKLGLVSAALSLLVLTHRHFTYALAGPDPEYARWHLRLLLGVEAAIGLAIVLAAGFLASLTPATEQQALWPFSWRLTFAALDDPEIRGRVALALVAAGAGVASLVLGLLWRRRVRLALMAIGVCLLVVAAPTVRLLLVKAYPTSYYRSPTGFAAISIMRGQQIFAADCAACHGAEGHGDGPLAGQLPSRPADLTAPHLWGHSDGELFWWVSNGLQASDGTQVMPAFAPLLSDAGRWSVIDFVRANNAGSNQHSTGAWVVPIVAPALPVVCADLPADEMRDLRGSVVRVVAGGDEEGDNHPPSIPPQEGYKVLILHLTRMSSTPLPPGECMAATPAAWAAYATLVGVRPDALPGAEFLVDPSGWLRAAWLPGSGRGWSTPDQLIARVRLICTHPITIDPKSGNEQGGHEHHD